MYILSPKSASKVVKQRVIANNQIKEVKLNHKEIIQRRVLAADKRTKNPGDNGKQKARRQGNPNMPELTKNINSPKIHFKVINCQIE